MAYVLRVHPGGGEYGAPYVASATVLARGCVAEVLGLTVQGGRFTRAHWRAVFAALGAAGFRWAEWERRDGDRVRSVRVAVQP